MVPSEAQKEVKDKGAVTSGGTSGLSLGVAQVFVRAGIKVAIMDANPASIATALERFEGAGLEDRVHAIRVDVTDRVEAAADKVVDTFGNVLLLVANAGVPRVHQAIGDGIAARGQSAAEATVRPHLGRVHQSLNVLARDLSMGAVDARACH